MYCHSGNMKQCIVMVSVHATSMYHVHSSALCRELFNGQVILSRI